jgi:hypothetical protein
MPLCSATLAKVLSILLLLVLSVPLTDPGPFGIETTMGRYKILDWSSTAFTRI